jgi:hypothetical protein
LENKTKNIHPNAEEMMRNSIIMGYNQDATPIVADNIVLWELVDCMPHKVFDLVESEMRSNQ